MRELDEIAAEPTFWDSPDTAQQLMQERNQISSTLDACDSPARKLDDLQALIEMAEEEGAQDFEEEIARELETVGEALDELEFQRMLSGEHDSSSAIMTINAGAGGREAQDWADMLLRMYLRWCERNGMRVELADSLEGEEGGIKSATIMVYGEYAYGLLRAEIGIHRLVRISPFDGQSRRHTSFASVFVYPQLDADIEVEISDSDLRVDTYRASGAGGQHVNKTSSAVRMTHLPTGVVVQCQNERSQHKNRAMAMKILAARLKDLEREKLDAERDVLEKTKMRIDFGSQIRSYVLAPYRLVKDHRTGFEMGNADAVLDGDLQGFIRSYLMAAGGKDSESVDPRSL